jgi:L-serine dehydratase
MQGDIKQILISFDPEGSLATTHKSQGSDMGLFGGFLGWEAHDERLPESELHLQNAGITHTIEIIPLEEKHPNTYQIKLSNERESHELVAISTGGGMIEVIQIDGNRVSMAGDYVETIVYCNHPQEVYSFLSTHVNAYEILIHQGKTSFIEIKSQQPLAAEIGDQLAAMPQVETIRVISPVLPIMARKNLDVPFITCNEMMAFNEGKGKALWELAMDYESQRGNISQAEVWGKMKKITGIMGRAIETGLSGTDYSDRILQSQSPRFREKFKSNQLIKGDILNTSIMYVTAIMEVKSSMGVIVAAPTAGSCGGLPGVVFGAAHCMDKTEDDIIKAMLSAGLIGVFIAAHATFAAEVGGCMAETGSGAGMAAAALAEMQGGSLEQSIGAASMALQNGLGIICDPIGNRVEAPCLGRNVMAATNAISCANMALSDYAHLIPLDEVIATMKVVGDQIHHTLRCTNLGGLSVTSTAKKIEAMLEANPPAFYKSC